jgi:hypothetical protein
VSPLVLLSTNTPLTSARSGQSCSASYRMMLTSFPFSRFELRSEKPSFSADGSRSARTRTLASLSALSCFSRCKRSDFARFDLRSSQRSFSCSLPLHSCRLLALDEWSERLFRSVRRVRSLFTSSAGPSTSHHFFPASTSTHPSPSQWKEWTECVETAFLSFLPADSRLTTHSRFNACDEHIASLLTSQRAMLDELEALRIDGEALAGQVGVVSLGEEEQAKVERELVELKKRREEAEGELEREQAVRRCLAPHLNPFIPTDDPWPLRQIHADALNEQETLLNRLESLSAALADAQARSDVSAQAMARRMRKGGRPQVLVFVDGCAFFLSRRWKKANSSSFTVV